MKPLEVLYYYGAAQPPMQSKDKGMAQPSETADYILYISGRHLLVNKSEVVFLGCPSPKKVKCNCGYGGESNLQ